MASSFAALAMLALAGGTAAQAEPSCPMQPGDRAWLARSLARWQDAARDWLGLVLLLGRLLPDLKARAFRDPEWRSERLLAVALNDG